MTNLNKICMSALLAGAAAIATPACAQAAGAASNTPQAQPSAPADAAPMDKAATSPSASNTQAAQAAEQPAQATASTNTQVAAQDQAMTHDTDVKAAANANVDAAGGTSKKYIRKNRAADFAKEQSITAQLNQQASAAAAPSSSVR